MKKSDYLKLITEHNGHSMALNAEGLVEAMDISFKEGKKEGQNEVLEWLSKMDYLSDNIQYIKEEWENQNKKI